MKNLMPAYFLFSLLMTTSAFAKDVQKTYKGSTRYGVTNPVFSQKILNHMLGIAAYKIKKAVKTVGKCSEVNVDFQTVGHLFIDYSMTVQAFNCSAISDFKITSIDFVPAEVEIRFFTFKNEEGSNTPESRMVINYFM